MPHNRRWIAFVSFSCLMMVALVAFGQERDPLIPPTKSRSAATGSAVRDSGTSPGDVTLPEEDPPPKAEPQDASKASVKLIVPAKPEAGALLPPDSAFPKQSFSRYDALITAITVFALAVFVGFEVINKVPTTLHTPLMSGSNAISGITVVGAIIVGGYSIGAFSSFLGFLAIALAMINVVGGFLVTHRMLAMFKRK